MLLHRNFAIVHCIASNKQNALAVGKTQEITKNAEFTALKLQVSRTSVFHCTHVLLKGTYVLLAHVYVINATIFQSQSTRPLHN